MSIYLGTSPIANTGYDKANTDLSNLTNTGKNIANWSNNVTNCITEIPQDIKLELNNGTLTLKSGSKITLADGTQNTISSDITYTSEYAGDVTLMICSKYDGTTLYARELSKCVSGAGATANGGFAFDTTANEVWYCLSNGTKAQLCSFPIATITVTSGTITSIDQVFNGFGYIGSTVFALPGVKGLIPNGRNADGTLKNTEFTIDKVLTRDIGNAVVIDRDVLLNDTYICFTECTYNKEDNLLYNPNGDVTKVIEACKITTDGSKITSFTPKTAFHAVDYNDSSTVAGWSMPSSRYIDLTLGAGGSTYTAPANGWFVIRKKASSSGQFWYFGNESAGDLCYSISTHNNDQTVEAFIPTKSGDTIRVGYNLGGSTTFFRFIYAEGEN